MSDAPHPLCGLCALTRAHRRGLCGSCYRKLRQAGCALPPRRPTGAAAHRVGCGCGRCPRGVRFAGGVAGLVAYVRLWPADVRARLLVVLLEAEAA